MTKGKKWTLRLLGVAALALLVSLCLMGSTMARYTSKGEGSGSLTVALWDVETAELEITTADQKVSPKETAYTGSTRSNTSGWVGSFTIVNNSDVDALVSFESDGEYKITWPDTEDSEGNAASEYEWEWGAGWTDSTFFDEGVPTGRAQTNEYGSALMLNFGEATEGAGKAAFEEVVNAYGIFTLTFGHTTQYDTEQGSSPDAPADESAALTADEKENGVAVSAGYSMDIYAEVVWTSIDESMQPLVEGGSDPDSDMAPSAFGFYENMEETSGDDWESFSDAVDTILGMYAQKLTFGVSWTAVQNSTLPKAA